MKIGEKETEINDLETTIKCSKKIIDHIRKREDNDNSSKNKSHQEQIRPSEHEKCFRTTFVRSGLLAFCAMGLGKPICESYDTIKDEEKKLGRKLSDHEIHQIIIDIAKRYKIIYDNHIDDTQKYNGGQKVE